MAFPFLERKPDSGLGNIRSSPGDPSRNIDWVLLGAQGVLTVMGMFVIYSATRFQVEGDPYVYVTRQVVFAIIATAVMAFVMSIDYEWFKQRAAIFYAATVAALVVLLGASFATGQDKISFDFGPFNVQPAEVAKFTVLLALATYLAEERSDEVSYPRFLGGLMIVGMPAGLIIIQPDLGSASVVITIAMGVLLVGGAKPRYIFTISLLAATTVVIAFFTDFVNDYQRTRLTAFLNQNSKDPNLIDDIYQARNALRAVGTGGLTGKGWLDGELTNGDYIPILWADFPFAAIGEQFGMIGCALVLSVFFVALARILRIASLSRDLLGTYLCAGVFTMLLWQMFQNIGMTLGIMPVTGIPLPFISYGGSSMITYFAMFGIVQSVHMRRMR